MQEWINRIACMVGLHDEGPVHVSGRFRLCRRCGAWWGWGL